MQAEVLSVGTELLLGQTVNTDTTIVAKALSMLGIDLLYAAVVGDNVKRLEKAVHDALERSDILITTGGLGPTGDDLTKETVAAAAGKALALHEPSYKRLMEYFARGGLSENQIKQAMLPGPPSELEPMLQNYAVPYLAQFQSAVIASHSVHVFGRGEAAVAEMIADLTENSNPTAAPYAKEGEMFVRVTAKAATQAEADALCAPVVEEIRRRVGSFVYSVDVDSLEALVVDALRVAGKTLATAESCTGGLLAKRITDVAGSSDVFEMGCVTYANRVKEKLLGVPHETLEAHGAVSEETARAMAEGIVRASGADIGVGITGIAGPGGGTAEKPVGLVYIALSDGKSTWVAKRQPAGRMKSREWHRHCAASKALDMVRRYLAGLPVDEA